MSISSMISNFKKLNFCNFFPHFPLLVRPCVFPIQMASSHTASPIKIPCISPIHLLFQRASFAATFSPAIPLVFFPFRASDRQNLYQKPDSSVQNWSLSGWIITCTGQEKGAFQGDFRVFGLEVSVSLGEVFGGGPGENFRDFSAVESPWKGENRGT